MPRTASAKAINSDTSAVESAVRRLTVTGSRVRNLQGVSIDVPGNSVVVICGVSGAGKSSLAVETLGAEGQRRFLETFPLSARRFVERLERPDAESIGPLPPAILLRQNARRPGKRATVATLAEIHPVLQQLWTEAGVIQCPECLTPVRAHNGVTIAADIAQWPAGTRFQIGFRRGVPPSADASKIIQELTDAGLTRIVVGTRTVALSEWDGDLSGTESLLVILDRLMVGKVTAERLQDSLEQALQHGDGRCEVIVSGDIDAGQTIELDGNPHRRLPFTTRLICTSCEREFATPHPRLFSYHSAQGGCATCKGSGELAGVSCPACHGRRLNDLALAVQVQGVNLAEFVEMSVEAAAQLTARWLEELSDPLRWGRSRRWIEQLHQRLNLAVRLGFGHLMLNRPGASLSTTEVHRLALIAVCSVRLVSALYILDEPAAGMHSSEVEQLVQLLYELQSAGNSLVVVENCEPVVMGADAVVEIGPGAGPEGGRVLFQGTPVGLKTDKASLISPFLSARSRLVRRVPRQPSGWLTLRGVQARGWQDALVEIPLGTLTAISGPSGSGRKTLVADVVYPVLSAALRGEFRRGAESLVRDLHGHESLNAIVYVDQRLPEKARQGHVATACDVWGEIRTILAGTEESKVRQFTAGTFSLHSSAGGRCAACRGQGVLAVDLQFLADLQVTCPECHGTRFQRDVLEVKYRGQNVAEILSLTANEALPFFRGRSRLQRKLKAIKDVGLGYLQLGQPVASLSGGETQRLQMASQMIGKPVGPTLFLLDEPAAGLHPLDIQNLLNWFDDLLSAGHSLVVIEQRPELLQQADHVIQMARDADGSSRIVSAGRPGG